jgi:predicted PurR-regulated permease PerM
MLKSPLARVLLFLVGLCLALWLVSALSTVLTSFALGFTLAYLLNPAVNWMEGDFERLMKGAPSLRRHLRPRSLAVAVLAVVVLVGLAAFIFLVVPAAIEQVKETAQRLPVWAQTLKSKVDPIVADLNLQYPDEVEAVRLRLRNEIQENLPKLVRPMGSLVGHIFSNALSLVLFLIHVVVIPVFAFYLLSDMNEIQERWKDLVPPRYREYVLTRVRDIDRLLSAFVQGQLLVCFLMGIFYGVALTLCRLPMGLVVGFLTSFFSLIPYMSTVLGLPLVVVLSLLDQHSGAAALRVALVYVLGHLVEGHFITPRLMGGRLGLHPVVVMLAILVWGTLFGFVGMLIAVPATAALSVFWEDLKAAYLESPFYAGAGPPGA